MPAILQGEHLRAAMRHVPSPVTIVTFPTPAGAKGITIGSFTSVSLDPPLISFNVMHLSSMHDLLLRTERYAVQVLREDQVALSERFSIPDLSSEEQFDGVQYRMGADGIPVLEDVLAIFQCRAYNAVPAGDHSLFIGEVIDAETLSVGKPLLYYQQSYRKVGGVAVS